MQGVGWEKVHEQLCRLARAKGVYEAEEARWLLEGKRTRVHEPLGFGSFLEYLERVFGYTPRLANEKLRVAEALETLPRLRAALATGALSWSAVRELSRVAVPDTEAEWIAAAEGQTVRDVERMVSGRSPGDDPRDPAKAGAMRHTVRFDLSGDALAALREARRALELEVGHALDDDDFVHALAERAHGGGDRDDGRAPYQIALSVCPACEGATRDGAGVELEVDAAVVEMARCDAQHIGSPHVGHEQASQTIPPRVRRQVLRRDHGRCQVPGCRAAKYIDLHHIVPRAEHVDHDPSNLICLCSAHHRALHHGALQITGTAPEKLAFFHADGTTYGAAASVTWPAPQVAPPAGQVTAETPRATGTAYRASATVARPAPRVAPPAGQVKVETPAANGTAYGVATNVPRPGPRVAPPADQVGVETPAHVTRSAPRVAPPAGEVTAGTPHAIGTASRVLTRVTRPAPRVASPAGKVEVEALSALRNLGIRARDAELLVRAAEGSTVEDLVRDALRGYASQCREPAAAYGWRLASEDRVAVGGSAAPR